MPGFTCLQMLILSLQEFFCGAGIQSCCTLHCLANANKGYASLACIEMALFFVYLIGSSSAFVDQDLLL